jgi:rhodanese-related sulfurtransferase
MIRFNRDYITYVFCASVILLCSGCDWFSKKETVPATAPAMVVIDVNDDRIYADAHIKGATHIPYQKLATLDKEAQTWDKNKPVVVYCTNYFCLASKDVAHKLQELGFKPRVYTGGVAEWYQLSQKDKGFVIEGPQQEAYLKKVIAPVIPEDKDIVVISAQDLRKQMEEAGLLK